MKRNTLLIYIVTFAFLLMFSAVNANAQSCPLAPQGDADCDGDVDGLDFVIFYNNYQTSTTNGPVDGDFNSDNFVDGVDFVIFYNNYGTGVSEPTDTPIPDFSNYTNNNGIPIPTSQAVDLGIPECPEEMHDPNTWHPLYVPPELITSQMNQLVSTDLTQTGCHYTHEHKANPHLMDDIFGDWLYQWGGTISYPWQTGATGVEENHNKHETYGYITLRNIDPRISSSREQGTDSDIAFIRDLRLQLHLDLHHQGAPTRFHSAFFEARVCRKDNPNDCGIARVGGHQDYEELRIDGVWYPLGNEPTDDISVLDANVSQRDHTSTQNRDGSATVLWRGRFRSNAQEETNGLTPWSYGGVTHFTDDTFTLADPNDVSRLIFSPNPDNNNSRHTVREMTFNTRGQMADETGRINFSGWSKRYPGHRSDPGCTQPSQDCVPIRFENYLPLSHLNFRSSSNGGDALPAFEYDTSPSGESWIEYPN